MIPRAHKHMDLAKGSNGEKFTRWLEYCLAATLRLTDWELNFAESIATQKRDFDLIHMGWNPTVKQWNQLHDIYLRIQ